MQITGVSLGDFYDLTEHVSRESYGGNVIVNPDAYSHSGNRITARLRVNSSRAPGARRAWSGRRTVAACWHAYRDVLSRVFDYNPDARIRTMMATYKGREGFLSDYPGTAYQNVGSQISPVTMPALCGCGESCPLPEPSSVAPVDIVDRIDQTVREYEYAWGSSFRYTPTDEPYPF